MQIRISGAIQTIAKDLENLVSSQFLSSEEGMLEQKVINSGGLFCLPIYNWHEIYQ
jgi:hypothetical protein